MSIIASFFIASMAGLGIGGGGLLVIYLSLVLKMEQLQAQGLNLLFFIFASSASLFFHFKKRNINLKLLLVLSICGVIGAIFGSITANFVNPLIIKKCFGALLILSGIIEIFRKKTT